MEVRSAVETKQSVSGRQTSKLLGVRRAVLIKQSVSRRGTLKALPFGGGRLGEALNGCTECDRD
jgi:hypothetical protein